MLSFGRGPTKSLNHESRLLRHDFDDQVNDHTSVKAWFYSAERINEGLQKCSYSILQFDGVRHCPRHLKTDGYVDTGYQTDWAVEQPKQSEVYIASSDRAKETFKMIFH
jgi:hypothetical protein